VSYFQIGVSPDRSLRNAGRAGFNTPTQATAKVRGLSPVEESEPKGVSKAPSAGLKGFKSLGSGAGFETNRFSPPNEPLDRETFLEDITPKSDSGLITMFDKIYREDAVAGAATDLIATLPWSDWTLSGVDDPAIMKIYEEAMESFNPEVTMPEVSRDYLKHGRVIMSLPFNEDTQTWDRPIPIDLMYADLTPIPIMGYDPLIDLRASPEMSALLKSKDPRARVPLASLPAKFRKQLMNGKVPLDTMTTLFLSRRVSLTDWKGTSLYYRILPYYAIERALMTSTLSAARRRTRSILHLTVGIEDKWDPTPEQLNEVIEAFETTEEDPVGAVIATRSGIEANEIRSGGDFWKISEEADFLKTGKLAALGLSESFLSGEASYSTVDASMSVFVENLKSFRATLTQRTFYDKYLDVLARVHNFTKRKKADLAHGVRTTTLATTDEAMSIRKSDLLMPTIHWTKNLSPESDASYMDILEKVSQQGVPVTIKQWASAAGIDISDLEQMLPEDQELRARLKKFLPKPPPQEGGGEGGGDFGAFSTADIRGSLALGSVLEDSKDNRSVLGITHKEFSSVVATLTHDNRKQRILRDDVALSRWLSERYDGDSTKVDNVRYLLTKSGFADCRISTGYIHNLAFKLQEKAKLNIKNRDVLKRIQTEVAILAAIYNFKSDRDIVSNSERSRLRRIAVDNSVKSAYARNTKTSTPASKLYAGV